VNTTLPAEPAAGLPRKLAAVARDIKLSHTVFAMPFALLATFLSAGAADRLPGLDEFVLIVVCMFLARTFAMTVNRLADAKLDGTNPRTAGRALPSGKVDTVFVWATAKLCALLFIVSAGGFWLTRGNVWPAVLAPFVLVYLASYSYTKRFTWLCHIYLGTALALSPIAATIAIDPSYLVRAEPWLLAGMVACWVGGFDVIYALQDIEHDQSMGLFSMPSRLGAGTSLWVSRALHMLTIVLLLGLWSVSPLLGVWFLAAAVLTIGLLVIEHALVWRSSTNRINVAFLMVNGVISLVLGAAGILEVVLAV
jgi:4-hydroxybenzoate polyprenyltransferase